MHGEIDLRAYTRNRDQRGDYVEVARSISTGQSAFSTTKPGITRGNHFHTRKVERFAVIKGRASIKLRRYGKSEVTEYILDGEKPAYVDMPIWYTHNITNIGDSELFTIFWSTSSMTQTIQIHTLKRFEHRGH